MKGRGQDEHRGREVHAHAVEAEEPVEEQLLERTEDFWVMAIARGRDVQMKCDELATKRVRCMKQWIIDSGAQTHVVRVAVAELFLGALKPSRAIELRGAGGHQLDLCGSVEILVIMNGRKFLLRAEIADVKRNLLSVSRLEDHGYAVLFNQKQSQILREDWHTKIYRKKNLYQIEGDILAMRLVSSTGGQDEIMQ